MVRPPVQERWPTPWQDRVRGPLEDKPRVADRIWDVAAVLLDDNVRLRELGLDAIQVRVWLPWDEVRDRPAEDERWLLERGIAVGWLARTERDDAWRHRLHPPAEVMAEVIERLREEAIP